MVENIEYGTLLIDADLQARIERDVTDEHAETYGDKEERFEFLLNTEIYEYQAYKYHAEMAPCDVGKTSVLHELDHLGRHKLHEVSGS
jgi:hypothetical protein